MNKITIMLIAASILGIGSMSFAQNKSAASIKDKPTATKTEPGTVGSIKDKPTAAKPRPTSPADANPKVKPPAGAVQDGVDKEKPVARKPFPLHWGKPPAIQTRDYRPLPGGFGHGSSTLAHWIDKNLKADAEKGKPETGKPGEKPGNGKPDGGVDRPKPEKPRFPPHWGRPPAIQTKDLRPLPGGFGMGSSTLAHWIDRNIKADLAKKDKPKPEPKRPPVVRPQAPPRPEISKETKTELAEIEKDKADLFKAMREELGKLEKGSTKEDVRKAVVNFKKENADKFAAIKEAADKVHEELKANRPERPERPEPTAEVKEKIKAVHVAHKEIHEARKDLRADLKEATDEQKKELIKDFKASQKEKHEDLKAAHKELRETIRANKEEGDRRTER
jgi:hypothetical protein